MKFELDLNQGRLDEKPIPKPLSLREFSPMQLLGIVLYSGSSRASDLRSAQAIDA